METDDIIRKIEIGINSLPADVLRLFALQLPYENVIKFCRTSKRFNREICQNNIFQIEYGLHHLTSYKSKLPRDKEGNYVVLKELHKINKLIYLHIGSHTIDKLFEYIVSRNYDQFIKNMKWGKIDRGLLLEFVSGYGDLDMVMYLLKDNIYMDHKIGALHKAIQKGHLEIIEYFPKHGVDITDKASRVAAESGNIEILKYLMERINIDINECDLIGQAARSGNLDMIKYVIELGSNPRAYNDSAIIDAAERGYINIVKYLHEIGLNIHTYSDRALRMAAKNDHSDVVRYLLDHGAVFKTRYG